MIVLGITGSIGMGKSTVAQMFVEQGAWLYNADIEVHRLIDYNGEVVSAIKKIFPTTFKNGKIDRIVLGSIVFQDDSALKALERILHPLILENCKIFLRKAQRAGASLVILDVPLLFETKLNKFCDFVIVVTAPSYVQYTRVMKRPFMTQSKFEAIQEKQIPDKIKCKLADIVISTGLGKRFTRRQVSQIIKKLRYKSGKIWPPSVTEWCPP